MSQELITLTVGLGLVAITHCLYLAISLLIFNRTFSNILLAALLVALSVRVGKSLVAVQFPIYMFELSAIGLIIMSTIGPLLFLYVGNVMLNKDRPRQIRFLHFIPTIVVGTVVLLWASQDSLYLGYCLVNLQLLTYLVISAVMSSRSITTSHERSIRRWMNYLLAGLTVISIAFIIQLIVDDDSIYLVTMLASVVSVYTVSLLARNYTRVFSATSRRRLHSNHHELAKRIEVLMSDEEAFIDHTLTLSKLSTALDAPSYQISEAIQHHFRMSFPEMLLHFRIKKAEKLLKMPEKNNFTIEAIADECGFTSVSAFYAGFKKEKRVTPSQYRKMAKVTSIEF